MKAKEDGLMLDWKEIQKILSRHGFLYKHQVATPWEGLVLGNADMGATVFGPAHRLCFRLGKMDLWDARWNARHYRPPLPLSKLKEWVFAESARLRPGKSIAMDLNSSWPEHEELYPCLRMGVDVLVRVCQWETVPVVGRYRQPVVSAPGMVQRLQLTDGLYTVEFPVGWWASSPVIVCRAFVSWQKNVLVLRLTIPQGGANHAVVSMWRDPWGGRSWELLSNGPSLNDARTPPFKRDPRSGALPPAMLKTDGNMATLYQTIPGDEFCPERGFSVAAVCAEEEAPFFMEPSGQAAVEALNHRQLTFYVAMASEMEAPDAHARAQALAKEAAQTGWDKLYEEHAAAWRDFWMKSAIEVEDQGIERTWARGLYNLAITARSGRPASGIYGVFVPNDRPPWLGDRHNNYPEYSSIFWGAFAANHEEQALNYTEFVHAYLPTARRIAREVYECDEGAAYLSNYIDGTEQYFFHFTWGWSLFLTAVHAQNCWWHYQYFGDHKFLEQQAYPVMRECVNFYAAMLRKNQPGDYTLWPTIATETRGWTKDFQLNKNCIEDLAHMKFLLRAVLEASEILGVDADRRPVWQNILEHLAPYPTLVLDGKEEFCDFAGQTRRPNYNHSVPLAPLWPAEDQDVVRDPRLRAIALNTLPVHPWDLYRLMMAYMRLGLKEKVWEKLLGQPPEADDAGNAGTVHLCCMPLLLCPELLLTSWDGVIRVFPCWPLEKKAGFRDLRTKGAFLVSASCANGQITGVMIRSERGNPIKIQSPWPKTRVFSEVTGREIKPACDGELLLFNTMAGELYRLERQLES